MSELARVAILVGSVLVVFHTPAVLRPASAREWLKSFPRSTTAGCILAFAGVAWAGKLLYYSSLLAWMPSARQAVLVVFPVFYVLIVLFMRELLAARALGGLLLLAPRVIIDAAIWHESRWRFVLIAMAYLFIVWGAILILMPYHFRKTVEWVAGSDSRLRVIGIVGLLFGAGIICLGMTVF